MSAFSSIISSVVGATPLLRPPNITVQIDPAWVHADSWVSPINRNYVEIVNFSYENGIGESQNVGYEKESPAGRAESYAVYQCTDSRVFQIPFTLFAACDDGETDIQAAIRKEVMDPYNFFNALKQPWRIGQANGSFRPTYAPPPVLVTMGQFFTARCVVVDFNGNACGVFDSLSLLPHKIDCTLVLQVARRTLPDRYDGKRVFT